MRTGVGDLNIDPTDDKSEVTNSDEEKAQIFAEYFSSVFTQEPHGAIPVLENKKIRVKLTDLRIEETDIKKVIEKLKPNKSPGPDGIHPKFIRNIGDSIATPLGIIFNASLQQRKLPDPWKQAKVCSIFKKGNKRLASNYRPVSLTAIICKLMESIIRNHIISYMKNNKLFSDKQYGFISGRSTSLQLLTVLEEWTDALDHGLTVDCIYMDYRKAFDTVPHNRLLGKLESYGFNDQLLGWIRSFLKGRTQKVTINDKDSSWKEVDSGIPQGSVLGPILFVIYINDLPELVSSKVYLFADDTKIYKVITDEEDRLKLQDDLNKLSEWSNTWLLKFHADKCKHMTIGRNKQGLEETPFKYKLNDSCLQTVKEEKDIGVTIDDELRFDTHISEKISKANSMDMLVRRTFRYLDKETFVPLYKSLVRSQLEYAHSVWAPYKAEHIEELEKVQRRATKKIPDMSNLSYPDRLKMLKLPTLAYRRLRGDLLEIYKILNGQYDKDTVQFVKLWKDEAKRTSPRGQQEKLYPQQSHLDLRKYSFTVRITKYWNELPEDVINAPSINSFKNRLDKHYDQSPLKYDNYRHIK